MQTFLKGKRVGYWLNDKKMKKLNFVAFVDMCRKRGIEMVQLDLSQPLEEQGPLDVIIHKLTDLILEAEKNDTQALLLVQCVQDYIEAHPETIVLDPLPAIRTLLDRWRSYQLIHRIESCMQDNRICSPPFMVLNSEYGPDTMKQIEKHGITLPFICKTRVAHGTNSHEMALIFSEEDLKDVKPPCVIQSFINHNAVLYKVFVVGESYTVVERPSLKNFPSGPAEFSGTGRLSQLGNMFRDGRYHTSTARVLKREAIFFNSHNVSKPECSSDLTSTVNYITTMPFNESSPPISSQHKYWEKRDNVEGVFQLPSDDVIRELSKALRQALGVSLFGIDVIISNQTGQHAVIDINAFPGYEGVPEFFTDLLNHITSLLQDPVPESAPSGQHRDSEAGQTPATAVPSAGHQDSSGILGKDGARTVENEAAKKAQGQRRGCNSALSANFQPHCLCPRATKASSQ